MMNRIRYTERERAIVMQEVSRSPENISKGILKAASIIFNSPDIVNFRGSEKFRDGSYRRISNLWYNRLSQAPTSRSTNSVFILQSKSRLAINRKTQRQDNVSAIPIQFISKYSFTRVLSYLKRYLK